MNTPNTRRLAWGWALAMTASCAAMAAHDHMPGAPSTDLTRSQVVAEVLASRQTHRWDEPSAQWVPLGPAKPAVGVRTRDEVRAERAAFAAAHRFDESQGGWIRTRMPARVDVGPTRDQVAASTSLFLETHAWDEFTQVWTEHARHSRMH